MDCLRFTRITLPGVLEGRASSKDTKVTWHCPGGGGAAAEILCVLWRQSW